VRSDHGSRSPPVRPRGKAGTTWEARSQDTEPLAGTPQTQRSPRLAWIRIAEIVMVLPIGAARNTELQIQDCRIGGHRIGL
jgi:hypothetical protein